MPLWVTLLLLGVPASWLVLAWCSSRAYAQHVGALPRAVIRPSIVRLAPGDRTRFRVVLSPRWLQPASVAEDVAWAVNGIAGGDSRLGTIDRSGVYSAPAEAPRPCEVHVCARVEGAENQHLWATVVIGAAPFGYQMTAKWEEPADGSVHLNTPSSIAVEDDGNFIISDAGCSKVFRYAREGTFLGTIGLGSGLGPGNFDGPTAVAVDERGHIFVSDLRTGPPRIQVFSREGEFLHAFAQKGIGPGQVMETRAMAFDPAGRLLAADSENMRINVYARDGTFLEAWQRAGIRPGEMNLPYGMVLDANGDAFVPGYYGPCQKFTGQGAYLFAFAEADPPDGPTAFTSAAGDRWGNVFLVVRDASGLVQNSVNPLPKPVRVLKFNNNGDLVASFPLWDDERGENAAAVDRDDRLHVVFKRNNTVGVATFEAH